MAFYFSKKISSISGRIIQRPWCDSFCAETILCILSNLIQTLELQRFCFQRSSYHSFNTFNTSFLCQYRIRISYCQKFLVLFFFPWGFIYRRCQNNVWSLVISDYFHKTINQLWTVNSKNDWIAKGAKKMFHVPSLKENWMKKTNGSFLINQVSSCMLPYTSYFAGKASFYSVPYLEYDFMIPHIARLNLAGMKISETSQEIPVVECYVSKVAGIHSQFI